MPVPINNSRPSLPYAPTQSLPNNTRFGILTTTQRPPTAEMLDAEFNALTDDVNMLAVAINDVQAGSIPGANDPLNANKVLKTDGANNLSWTYVTNAEIEVNAVVEQKLAAQAVTTPKIGDAAVTTQKIAQNAVATNQIIDANVTTVKIADNAIITSKITDLAITTAKLANQAVTQGQIANAAVGTPQLIDGNVTTAKIADAAVTTQQLADAAVTTAKINDAAVTSTKLADSSVGTPALINGSITANKLDPIVARGITVAAGTFKFSDQAIDISRCFGVSSILYINSANYAHFRVTYEGVYTNPPIVTATSFFVVNLAPVSAPIGISSASNQSCIIAVGAQFSSALNNPNAFISFQVISRG